MGVCKKCGIFLPQEADGDYCDSCDIRPVERKSPEWQPDRAVSACTICHAIFTLLNRRHHCRICGRIVCKDCYTKSPVIPTSDHQEIVCVSCLEERRSRMVEFQSSTSGNSLNFLLIAITPFDSSCANIKRNIVAFVKNVLTENVFIPQRGDKFIIYLEDLYQRHRENLAEEILHELLETRRFFHLDGSHFKFVCNDLRSYIRIGLEQYRDRSRAQSILFPPHLSGLKNPDNTLFISNKLTELLDIYYQTAQAGIAPTIIKELLQQFGLFFETMENRCRGTVYHDLDMRYDEKCDGYLIYKEYFSYTESQLAWLTRVGAQFDVFWGYGYQKDCICFLAAFYLSIVTTAEASVWGEKLLERREIVRSSSDADAPAREDGTASFPSPFQVKPSPQPPYIDPSIQEIKGRIDTKWDSSLTYFYKSLKSQPSPFQFRAATSILNLHLGNAKDCSGFRLNIDRDGAYVRRDIPFTMISFTNPLVSVGEQIKVTITTRDRTLPAIFMESYEAPFKLNKDRSKHLVSFTPYHIGRIGETDPANKNWKQTTFFAEKLHLRKTIRLLWTQTPQISDQEKFYIRENFKFMEKIFAYTEYLHQWVMNIKSQDPGQEQYTSDFLQHAKDILYLNEDIILDSSPDVQARLIIL